MFAARSIGFPRTPGALGIGVGIGVGVGVGSGVFVAVEVTVDGRRVVSLFVGRVLLLVALCVVVGSRRVREVVGIDEDHQVGSFAAFGWCQS